MTEEKFTKILTKALADQEGRVNKRFDRIDKRFDVVDKRFDDVDQKFDDQSRDLKDFVTSSISASEKRTDGKLEKLKTEIIEGVVDFMDRSIIPQLENHERRLTRLEHKHA